MKKLIIFDLDGVLYDSKIIHFESLNQALKNINDKYQINFEEHLAIYDGLPTLKKLELLNINKNLPNEHNQKIAKENIVHFDIF